MIDLIMLFVLVVCSMIAALDSNYTMGILVWLVVLEVGVHFIRLLILIY